MFSTSSEIKMKAAVKTVAAILRPVATRVALLSVFLLGLLGYTRLNLTPSLPRGLYLPYRPDRPLAVGALLTFCPPPSLGAKLVAYNLEPRGHCPGGSVPLAKRLLAQAPHLCSESAGVRVNGVLYPWPSLPASRPLPRLAYCGPTPEDCLIVTGDSSDSIDYRVFGCVSAHRVQYGLIPVLTEKGFLRP
jgi:type IV secretory pathway protease TraF